MKITECWLCKNYQCYDDGDGRYDIWCDAPIYYKYCPEDYYPDVCWFFSLHPEYIEKPHEKKFY